MRGVKLDVIRPCKLTVNVMIEFFNGQLRDECVNLNDVAVLDDVNKASKAWRHECNHCRPNRSLSNLTPREYGFQGSKNDPGAPNSSLK